MIFKDINELKDRVHPALKKRSEDLMLLGCNITSEDIWNDLKDNRWKKSFGLTLAEIIDDILKYLPRLDSDRCEK